MTTDREKFDEAMLASLTEEERAGLLEEDEGEGDDDDDADTAGADGGAAEEDDNGSDDGDDDGAGADDSDGADEEAAAAAAAAAADAEAAAKLAADAVATDDAGAEAAGADEAGADTSDDADEKRPAWLDAQDLTAQKTELKQQLVELAKKFDAGDLMAEEYNTQREAIEEQREALLKQEIKTETQRDLGLQAWRDDVAKFSKDKPQYQPGGILREALDKKVKELQVNAVNPLSPKLLAKAHEEIQKALGLPIGKAETPAPKKEEKPAASAPRRPAPPPTLAHIPATDITDADDGAEFSHLDQLLERDSVGFEEALKRLTPADRDRYLAR
jgi:hypothetical protein